MFAAEIEREHDARVGGKMANGRRIRLRLAAEHQITQSCVEPIARGGEIGNAAVHP